MNVKLLIFFAAFIVLEHFHETAAVPTNIRALRKKRAPIPPAIAAARLVALKVAEKATLWITVFTTSTVVAHAMTSKMDEKRAGIFGTDSTSLRLKHLWMCIKLLLGNVWTANKIE